MEIKTIKGSPTTRSEAVLNNIGLVRKVSHRYVLKAKKAGLEFEDLENTGVIGLMKAFDDYDDTMGIEFSTYATHKIFGEISRSVQNGYEKGIRYPVHILEAAARIKKNDLQEEPTEVIASKLGMPLKRVKRALDYLNTDLPVRLDARLRLGESQGEGSLVYETIGGEQDFTMLIVNDFLSVLNQREREVVLCVMEGHSNTDIARRWGTSTPLVRYYRARLKDKLSNYMGEHYISQQG